MNQETISLFSQLPKELIHHILEFDGKIICPKMDKIHQSNIIHYLKNANKQIRYIENFLPYRGHLIHLILYGLDYTYLGNDLIYTKTYNFDEEEDIEQEQYLFENASSNNAELRIYIVSRLEKLLNNKKTNNLNINVDSTRDNINKLQRQLSIIDGEVLPREQNYPEHHPSILYTNKRIETTHFRHDRTKPREVETDIIMEIFM